MQIANANPPVQVTGRHISVTDAIKEYAVKKVEGLHLDYPKIIEAHVILDVQKYRQSAEIVLHCNNHITIEASDETDDMYASIDGALSKIARRMRKYKTRILRSHRPRKEGSIRHFEDHLLNLEGFQEHEDNEPQKIQTEKYHIKPMFVDEAVLQMEMSKARQFLVFQNAQTEKLNIVYRRKGGELGLIEPTLD